MNQTARDQKKEQAQKSFELARKYYQELKTLNALKESMTTFYFQQDVGVDPEKSKSIMDIRLEIDQKVYDVDLKYTVQKVVMRDTIKWLIETAPYELQQEIEQYYSDKYWANLYKPL